MTIRTLALSLPTLFLGWLSVLAAVALLSNAAPAYVVLLPSSALIQGLGTDIAILSRSRFSVTLSSDRAGFASRLYGKGAWLVLPAGLPGCLPLPPAR